MHAQAAGAGTLWRAGPYLSYVAFGGETNSITVTGSGTTITVTDPTATITVGADCVTVTAHSANCDAMSLVGLNFQLDDMNDSFTSSVAVPVSVNGGDGNDTLTGSAADDTLLDGGAGDDSLDGGGGGDVLDGGLGHDNVQGGSGDDYIYANACNGTPCPADVSDVFDGGPGTDWVTYGGRERAGKEGSDQPACGSPLTN